MSDLAVLCAGGQQITSVNYDKPGHPRSMHGDVPCDHPGPISIGDKPA